MTEYPIIVCNLCDSPEVVYAEVDTFKDFDVDTRQFVEEKLVVYLCEKHWKELNQLKKKNAK